MLQMFTHMGGPPGPVKKSNKEFQKFLMNENNITPTNFSDDDSK